MSEAPPIAYFEASVGGQVVALPASGVCHIGRSDRNEIVLPFPQVSSQHAMVQCTPPGEYILTDVGSRNGTFVNRTRVTTPVALQPGDRVAFGGQEFVFRGPAARVETVEQGGTVAMFSQQTITVLVTDIRGFTGLSAKLGERAISELVSAFTREAGKILRENGAWAQKYIGDAVMALWVHEAEEPRPSELRPALHSALRLSEVAAGLHLLLQLDEPVRIGAGLNTGLACLGNMGSDASADYTALSEAVNVAFRLESATKEIGCDVALGKRTFSALPPHWGPERIFACHSVTLKGYQEPKPAYGACFEDLRTLPTLMDRAPAQGGPAE